MYNIKRLIAFYHEPGNHRRLLHVLWLNLSVFAILLSLLADIVWRAPAQFPRPSVSFLDYFISHLPTIAFSILWVVFGHSLVQRASFDVPWRIRILEYLPAILLGIAYIFVLIAY